VVKNLAAKYIGQQMRRAHCRYRQQTIQCRINQ